MSSIRRVNVQSGRTPALKNAIFHEWGSRNYPSDDGMDFKVSCAIVEDDKTGQVYTVDPDNITFI